MIENRLLEAAVQKIAERGSPSVKEQAKLDLHKKLFNHEIEQEFHDRMVDVLSNNCDGCGS